MLGRRAPEQNREMPVCSQNRSEGEAWPGSCLLTPLLTALQIHLFSSFWFSGSFSAKV